MDTTGTDARLLRVREPRQSHSDTDLTVPYRVGGGFVQVKKAHGLSPPRRARMPVLVGWPGARREPADRGWWLGLPR
jgi:hypothetical protein